MRRMAVWACVLLLAVLFSPLCTAQDSWQPQSALSRPGTLSSADDPYADEMRTAAFVGFNSETVRLSLLPLKCLGLLSAYVLLCFAVRRIPNALRMADHRTRHILACKTCHPQLAPPIF